MKKEIKDATLIASISGHSFFRIKWISMNKKKKRSEEFFSRAVLLVFVGW